MKKFDTEFLMHLLAGVASIALMLIGLIMLVASFFTPLSTFNAVMLLAMGIIMSVVVKLYFMFREVLQKVSDLLSKYSSLFSQDMKSPISSEVITINENTTPEEIEELKKKHPMVSAELDKILQRMGINEGMSGFMSSMGLSNEKKDIANMSIPELEKALEKAVNENEFETAAEIRDEIKRRK